jgi:hypothetical protein
VSIAKGFRSLGFVLCSEETSHRLCGTGRFESIWLGEQRCRSRLACVGAGAGRPVRPAHVQRVTADRPALPQRQPAVVRQSELLAGCRLVPGCRRTGRHNGGAAMTKSDDTKQAPPAESETEEVTGLSPLAGLDALAWSDYDDGPQQRQSWRRTTIVAGVLVTCGVLLAGGIGAALWASRQSNDGRPMPTAAKPSVTSSVSAAPAPTTSTVTQTVTAPAPSDAAYDQLFLQRLYTDGFNNNSPEMAGYAHMVCNDLRQGKSEFQVVQWLSVPLLGMDREWLTLFVDDAKASYPNCAHT